MAYCSNCGKEIEDGVRYCPECGAVVTRQVNTGLNPYPPVQTWFLRSSDSRFTKEKFHRILLSPFRIERPHKQPDLT